MAERSYLGYAAQLPSLEERDPHTKPTSFARKSGSKELEVVLERRPSLMLCVNRIRDAVDEWRDAQWEGGSRTTRRLFRWWFDEAESAGFRPYWGQREAVETLAYLVEIKEQRDVKELIDGYQDVPDPSLLDRGVSFRTTSEGARQVVRAKSDGGTDIIDLPPADLLRYAFKMATGTGKTLVMALALIWSYFHADREDDSPLSKNFLILAPNVIVFERLRTDFERSWVFHNLPLVPPDWSFDVQVILRGESLEPTGRGNLFLTNIQQLYELTSSQWKPKNALDRLLGRKPTGDPAEGRRMLDRIRDLDSLVVMNDEAHHVHDEDLEWNKTLAGLHQNLPLGLAAWLDFSATPKFQSGVYYPWIVCDYPLAQAVEDGIVKTPVILHMVNKKDPDRVTRATVIDKYHDWLVAGVERMREHTEIYAEVDTKPVMFVMCESIQHADEVGKWLRDPSGGALEHDAVLVIHTDKKGEIRKGELDELRRLAREIDEPESPIKVVVSVLVLREGWDVRNVSVVLGLRPGTSEAKILPEQAVGRGLRLMLQQGQPLSDQVLEVLGTEAFETFVRGLEAEGVHVDVETQPPKPPIKIAPLDSRRAYDISIPRTSSFLVRRYSRIEELEVDSLEPLFEMPDEDGSSVIRLRAELAAHGHFLGEVTVVDARIPLASEIVAQIADRTQRTASLTGEFARLVPIIDLYLRRRCFGTAIDLDAEEGVRRFLGRPDAQEVVADALGASIGQLVAEAEPISIEKRPIFLSEAEPFLWRRERVECAKTVFNLVATYNSFESDFAEFLDRCVDVTRFSALAGIEDLSVQYVKPSGAMGLYYPDWVVVQENGDSEVNWIVETKGRVWEGTERKDAAVEYWCSQVSEQSSAAWRYVRVNQDTFEKQAWESLRALTELVD